jgi:uncharacterized protein (DUF2267 family)
MSIDFDRFVGHVMRAGGLDAADARRAIFATIRALGDVLDQPIAMALRAELPRPMALMMLANAPRHRPSAFFSRVAAHEGRSLGTAKEHAETICRILGAVLADDLVIRIGKDLGNRALFESPSWPEVPPHGLPSEPPASHTLATGKPGYAHPIAESKPPETAHRHSVARSENPHGDVKLSSTRGTIQERVHETLTTRR